MASDNNKKINNFINKIAKKYFLAVKDNKESEWNKLIDQEIYFDYEYDSISFREAVEYYFQVIETKSHMPKWDDMVKTFESSILPVSFKEINYFIGQYARLKMASKIHQEELKANSNTIPQLRQEYYNGLQESLDSFESYPEKEVLDWLFSHYWSEEQRNAFVAQCEHKPLNLEDMGGENKSVCLKCQLIMGNGDYGSKSDPWYDLDDEDSILRKVFNSFEKYIKKKQFVDQLKD